MLNTLEALAHKVHLYKSNIEYILLTVISVPTFVWLGKVVDVFGTLVAILVGLSVLGLNLLKGIEALPKAVIAWRRFKKTLKSSNKEDEL